jgi:hypothetical protein
VPRVGGGESARDNGMLCRQTSVKLFTLLVDGRDREDVVKDDVGRAGGHDGDERVAE